MGQGKQQECLTEGVQLELVGDAVPDDVVSAGIAGKIEFLHRGNGSAVSEVGRRQLVTVGRQSSRDPPHRVVKHGFAAADRSPGSTDIAGVAHPDVAVVVVPVSLRTFGQRCRCGGHGAALGARQAA